MRTQTKRQRPWPLERAELIKRHNDATNAARVECRLAIAAAEDRARRSAFDEIALRYMDDELREHVYKSAVRELGDLAGKLVAREIDKAWHPHDEALRTQDIYRRKTLDAAMMSIVLSARTEIAPSMVTVMRVDFGPIPSAQFAIGIPELTSLSRRL